MCERTERDKVDSRLDWGPEEEILEHLSELKLGRIHEPINAINDDM